MSAISDSFADAIDKHHTGVFTEAQLSTALQPLLAELGVDPALASNVSKLVANMKIRMLFGVESDVAVVAGEARLVDAETGVIRITGAAGTITSLGPVPDLTAGGSAIRYVRFENAQTVSALTGSPVFVAGETATLQALEGGTWLLRERRDPSGAAYVSKTGAQTMLGPLGIGVAPAGAFHVDDPSSHSQLIVGYAGGSFFYSDHSVHYFRTGVDTFNIPLLTMSAGGARFGIKLGVGVDPLYPMHIQATNLNTFPFVVTGHHTNTIFDVAEDGAGHGRVEVSTSGGVPTVVLNSAGSSYIINGLGIGVNAPNAPFHVRGPNTELQIGYLGASESYFDSNQIHLRNSAGAALFVVNSAGYAANYQVEHRQIRDDAYYSFWSSTNVRQSYIQSSGGNLYLSVDASSRNWGIYGSTGHWMPNTDAIQNLGSPTQRVNNSYFAVAPTVGSDARLKSLREGGFTPAEFAAWGKVEGAVWKLLQAIEEKGEEAARWHFGFVAQQIDDAFASEGLDAREYGLWCEDLKPERDENGEPLYDEMPDLAENGDEILDDAPVFEEVPRDVIEEVFEDGKCVRKTSTITETVQAVDTFPVFNEDGTPVWAVEPQDAVEAIPAVEPTEDAPGSPEIPGRPAVEGVQATKKIARTEKRLRTKKVLRMSEETVLSLRYEECYAIGYAWLKASVLDLRSRVESLEASQQG